MAKKVKERMKAYKNVKVINEDFFDFYRANKESVQYDLILGNPPYIRYQYLEEHQDAGYHASHQPYQEPDSALYQGNNPKGFAQAR